MSTSSHILALDIGTSSTRALLFDAKGHSVGKAAQNSYHNQTTPDGGVQTDADELCQLTLRCIDELLQDQENIQFAGVAGSCFWHSILAVDENHRALTPVYSWADNRAAPWVEPLHAALDAIKVHARTGCVFHPSYWPAKLLWLQATQSELFAKDTQVRWMSFGEYLALQLTGEARVSLSMASGTGLFDQNACDWDGQVLAALPITREQLSPLCDADDALPPLREEYQKRWPQLKNARWFPALGDGACSNIGSGGIDASQIVMNCGTSGALRIVLENWQDAAPRGLWRYRVDRNRVVMGGALSNGGNVLQWALDTLKLPEDWNAQLARPAKNQQVAHGLDVLPFLAGERSPLWNARAHAALAGATLDTTALEMLRAYLEGASLRFRVIADALRAAMREADLEDEVPIIYSGGALDASPAWAQIMCDVLGRDLIESREKEGSARGAALLALEALGLIDDLAEVPAARGQTLQPDHAQTQRYERALERQNALYEQIYGRTHLDEVRKGL